MPPPVCGLLLTYDVLAQEIVISAIVIESGKVILSAASASKRLTVTDLLKVVQTAGDSFIAVGVECVEVDACPAVTPE